MAVWLLVTFTLASGGAPASNRDGLPPHPVWNPASPDDSARVLGDKDGGDASAPHRLGKRQPDSVCLPRPYLAGITRIILKGPAAPDPDETADTAAPPPSPLCAAGSPGLVTWGVPYGTGLTTSRTPTGPPDFVISDSVQSQTGP